MDDEELKSYLEKLADDLSLNITKRQINKLVNLTKELKEDFESDESISLEEIQEEFESQNPSDDDDSWSEFSEELAKHVFDIFEESYSSDEELESDY